MITTQIDEYENISKYDDKDKKCLYPMTLIKIINKIYYIDMELKINFIPFPIRLNAICYTSLKERNGKIKGAKEINPFYFLDCITLQRAI